ncbi:MAG TPA: response regulator [Petrotogaceae bacterium]|jgi:two-component system chemotaxis response regulator CheY|nr:response regulator [Petrotogaceae bacterium]HQF32767.1 response regulator [Petrotogaceae bacterium]HQH33718.1 response regulator [Petrotogaceae bacterium]HQI79234.1 response regulator [Petrotogaceae bacterium]
MNVLIIEDDPISQKLLSSFLKEYAVCDIANDGAQGISFFESSLKSNKRYDLVCLDIMMPQMDGIQVLQKIRSAENKNGIYGLDGTKIIMTTALSDVENVRNSFKAQCEAYIIKPILKKDFILKLQELGLLKGG